MRAIVLSLVTVVLGLGAGCSGPVGTWTLDKVEPAGAAAQFDVKRVTFHPDHSYTLKARRGNTLIDSRGRYELDTDAGLLRFVPDDGPERVYRVEICGGCGLLYLMNTGDHQLWKATLRRR